jgi:hypothetical protein
MSLASAWFESLTRLALSTHGRESRVPIDANENLLILSGRLEYFVYSNIRSGFTFTCAKELDDPLSRYIRILTKSIS